MYKVQVGCVIVRGSRILAIGWNKIRHMSRGKRFSRYAHSLHAERCAAAQIKDKDSLKGSTVFVFRAYKNGDSACARPCADCMELLRFLKVKQIVYSVEYFPFYEIIKPNNY